MRKMKNNDLEARIGIPGDFQVKGGDGRAISSWDEVENADGYILSYYRAGEPELCIKTRYSQKTEKTILGFQNGVQYLADVCAYQFCDGVEIRGEKSDKIPFVPVSMKLKAQNVICLSENESKKIEVEYQNTVPSVHFHSEDEDIAVVDDLGMVTARKKGMTEVISRMDNGESAKTRIECDRDLLRSRESDAVVMLMGDLMCAVNHQRSVRNKEFDFAGSFEDIRTLVQKGDLAIGVLETMCDDHSPYECEELRTSSGSPNCNSPSTFIGALKDAGFDALITANNHNCDTGPGGLKKTVSLIRDNGMQNIGTLNDNPVYFSVNGIKIAVIALCMINNGHEDGMNLWMEELGRYKTELFKQYVGEARKNHAKFIIAYQHWGTMNSSEIKPSQIKAAQEMAEAGADLIVASHPHVMQKYEILTTSDGRTVPCAYSLGNFLTSMSEFDDNRLGAVMCCRLHKNLDGQVSSFISFIPTICRDSDSCGVRIGIAGGTARERIEEILSKNASVMASVPKPEVLLQGSVVLKKIFSYLPECRANQAACIISQLSILNGEKQELKEQCAERVRLDVEKDFEQSLLKKQAEYVIVDFYAAAAISLYQLDDNYYTASDAFVLSDFYKSNQEKFKKHTPPFSESFWKEQIKKYAGLLLKYYPKEKIVLVRLSFSEMLVVKGEVRNGKNRSALNARLGELESYFISIVNPVVIDIAGHYFGDAQSTSPSAFEEYFYLDVVHKLGAIFDNKSHQFYYSEDDPEFRMNRILKYYDNLMARGYQNRMLNQEQLADKIIMYSSGEFVRAHYQGILELMRHHVTSLEEAAIYLEENALHNELLSAAKAIQMIVEKDLSGAYECYRLLFLWKMRILKDMALQLSELTGFSVCEDECEIIFLIKGNAKALEQYLSAHHKIKVDIWGSCISREIMNRNKRDIVVNKYIFKQPHLLAFEAPVSCEVPKDDSLFENNAWRRRTIEEAFRHSGIDVLKASSADWIVIDFYDLICNAVMFRGQLWEIDDFVQRTGFYKQVSGECSSTTCFFESYDMEYADEQMKKFARFLLEKYGENIILIKADLKDTYIDLDDRLQKLSNAGRALEKRKQAILQYEKMFEDLTKCYVIDISKHYYASDKFPLGGAHIVHYEDEFYNQSCSILMQIFSGSGRKCYDEADDRYLFLRDRRLNRESY